MSWLGWASLVGLICGRMDMRRCDMCDNLATHFFITVTVSSDGRTVRSRNKALCAIHANAYQDEMDRDMLNRLPQTLRTMQNTSPDSIEKLEITFAAERKAAATAMQVDLTKTCGGEASVLESPDEWETLWRLPLQPNSLDRWDCENWSQRLFEISRQNGCTFVGFEIGHGE